MMFIAQLSLVMIVYYDHNMFIAHATGYCLIKHITKFIIPYCAKLERLLLPVTYILEPMLSNFLVRNLRIFVQARAFVRIDWKRLSGPPTPPTPPRGGVK